MPIAINSCLEQVKQKTKEFLDSGEARLPARELSPNAELLRTLLDSYKRLSADEISEMLSFINLQTISRFAKHAQELERLGVKIIQKTMYYFPSEERFLWESDVLHGDFQHLAGKIESEGVKMACFDIDKNTEISSENLAELKRLLHEMDRQLFASAHLSGKLANLLDKGASHGKAGHSLASGIGSSYYGAVNTLSLLVLRAEKSELKRLQESESLRDLFFSYIENGYDDNRHRHLYFHTEKLLPKHAEVVYSKAKLALSSAFAAWAEKFVELNPESEIYPLEAYKNGNPTIMFKGKIIISPKSLQETDSITGILSDTHHRCGDVMAYLLHYFKETIEKIDAGADGDFHGTADVVQAAVSCIGNELLLQKKRSG